jgi:hypothetical protein
MRSYLLMLVHDRCWYCGTEDSGKSMCNGTSYAMVHEHCTPTSRGGTFREKNRVTSCHPCNSRKGSKTLDEYREWMRSKMGDLGFLFWGENETYGELVARARVLFGDGPLEPDPPREVGENPPWDVF